VLHKSTSPKTDARSRSPRAVIELGCDSRSRYYLMETLITLMYLGQHSQEILESIFPIFWTRFPLLSVTMNISQQKMVSTTPSSLLIRRSSPHSEWIKVKTYPTVMDIVCSASNRLLVDSPLCGFISVQRHSRRRCTIVGRDTSLNKCSTIDSVKAGCSSAYFLKIVRFPKRC
jgi:hypothetical protein